MKTHPQHLFIYVTCPDLAEAKTIASAILEARLAACANIFDNMQSMYWWQGNINIDNECVLIFKSEARLFERLKEKILNLHSYETPCVVALPVHGGSKNYLDWISSSVAQE